MHVWLDFMSSVDKGGSSTLHVLEWPPSPPTSWCTKLGISHTRCSEVSNHLVHDSLVKLIVGNEHQSLTHCVALFT